MSYYKEYLTSILGKDIPEGWKRTNRGYKQGEVEVMVQKGKPEEGWNTAVFRGEKIVGCWYSCREKQGIMVKARELLRKA